MFHQNRKNILLVVGSNFAKCAAVFITLNDVIALGTKRHVAYI